MSQHYMPFHTPLKVEQTHAIQTVIETCVPCNIMCMRPPAEDHIRYQHVHRVSDLVVCITLPKTRRSSTEFPHYYVFTTDSLTRRSEGLTVPFGFYPVPALEWYPAYYGTPQPPSGAGTSSSALYAAAQPVLDSIEEENIEIAPGVGDCIGDTVSAALSLDDTEEILDEVIAMPEVTM